MVRSNIILTTMVALITLAGVGAAFAGENGNETDQRSELNAVTNAKTSLSQAIAAAEQETRGNAVDASLENQDGVMAYEVEIAKGNTLQRVLVEPDSGKIIRVTVADADDENAQHENHDEEGEHEGE
jgi:uncharacterized membrane protein YkoI